eukprot:6003695-Pyramimonas_sp.AAC.3
MLHHWGGDVALTSSLSLTPRLRVPPPPFARSVLARAGAGVAKDVHAGQGSLVKGASYADLAHEDGGRVLPPGGGVPPP